MTSRSKLYFEVFDWLFVRVPLALFCRISLLISIATCRAQMLSNHDALSSGMAMPQMLRSSAVARPVNGKSTTRERTVIYEGAESPRVALENIVIQATAAANGMERTKSVAAPAAEGEEIEELPVDSEHEKMKNFCARIIKTSQDVDKALRDQKGAFNSQSSPTLLILRSLLVRFQQVTNLSSACTHLFHRPHRRRPLKSRSKTDSRTRKLGRPTRTGPRDVGSSTAISRSLRHKRRAPPNSPWLTGSEPVDLLDSIFALY